jgi:hypothetical protein
VQQQKAGGRAASTLTAHAEHLRTTYNHTTPPRRSGGPVDRTGTGLPPIDTLTVLSRLLLAPRPWKPAIDANSKQAFEGVGTSTQAGSPVRRPRG